MEVCTVKKKIKVHPKKPGKIMGKIGCCYQGNSFGLMYVNLIISYKVEKGAL
jgi:hypothetical protein